MSVTNRLSNEITCELGFRLGWDGCEQTSDLNYLRSKSLAWVAMLRMHRRADHFYCKSLSHMARLRTTMDPRKPYIVK